MKKIAAISLTYLLLTVTAAASTGSAAHSDSVGHTTTTVADRASPADALSAAFTSVAALPNFQTLAIERNDDYGFPECFGRGIWTVHGNSGPKNDVLSILTDIPAYLLVYEEGDPSDKICRIYLDESTPDNVRLLYFIAGTGSNDIAVALFENGDATLIRQNIDRQRALRTEEQ